MTPPTSIETQAGVRPAFVAQRRIVVRVGLLIGSMCGIAGHARGQWTVTNLHPAGAENSYLFTVDGSQQGGQAWWAGGEPVAGIWNGSAQSFVSFHVQVPGSYGSAVYGLTGTHQIGSVGSESFWSRAILWSGEPQSFVDLTPLGFGHSSGYGAFGMQQVGEFALDADDWPNACLWTGTRDSFVDLQPAWAIGSTAHDTSGTQQVGLAYGSDGRPRASLWSGDAASSVNLHPVGTTASVARSISGSQQAGYVNFGTKSHAALWSGTAVSWVDLHPAGATASAAEDNFGPHQVGWVELNGPTHAALWSGTSQSFVDLHAFLPTTFVSSQATSVWTDGTSMFIGGYGSRSFPPYSHEALLWTSTIPEPRSMSLLGAPVLAIAALIRRARN